MEIDLSSQSAANRKTNIYQGPGEVVEEEKLDSRFNVNISRFSSFDSIKQTDVKTSKRNKKLEFSSSRVSPIPSGSSHWSNVSKSLNPVFGSSKKFFSASVPGSRIVSRATSPISRRPSPPRSTTPTPTLSGLTSPRFMVDDAKMTNDNLSQEVLKLRAQVENLTRKSQLQEVELERATKQLKEAIAIAEEETAKCKAAKEVIKSLTAQLKDMAERLSVGAARNGRSPSLASFGTGPPSIDTASVSIDQMHSPIAAPNELDSNSSSLQVSYGANSTGHKNRLGYSETMRNGTRTGDADPNQSTEWVEQDEPGVYITLISLPGGVKDLKRVRFSRKRFSEKQAEQWWAENRARVYEQYNVRMVDRSAASMGSDEAPH